MRQQVLVNGPLGTSHWKRCRVHQEADRGHCADGARDGSDGRVRQLGCCVEARGSHQKGGRCVQCSGGRCGDDRGDSGAYCDDCRGSNCAVLSRRDDRDQECGGGREFHDQVDHGHWVTSVSRIEICDGCGMSAGLLVGSAANLEHPPLGGFGWDGTETDLKENVLELEADDLDEKIINDGVKVKRLKVRAWGGVHMSQPGSLVTSFWTF